MEVNRLLGDELSYEIQIRKLSGVDSSVLQKREIVREAFRLERLGLVEAPIATDLDPKGEINICQRKIVSLEEDVRDFDLGNRENELKRIRSRLQHVQGRLLRIVSEEPAILQGKFTLLNWVRQLMEDLTKVNSQEQPSLVDLTEEGGATDVPGSTDRNNQSLLDEPNIVSPTHQPPTLRPMQLPTVTEAAESLPPHRYLPANVLANTTHITTSRAPDDVTVNRFTAGRLLPSGDPQIPQELRRSTLTLPSQLLPNTEPQDNSRSFQYLRAGTSLSNLQLQDPRIPVHQDYVYASTGSEEFRNDLSRLRNVRFQDDRTTAATLDSADLAARFQDLRFSPSPSRFHDPSSDWEARDRYVDIGRWNVRYDGISSVNDFLQRVEELRMSRGVSKERLLRSAPELFTKDALLWYRMGRFSSWDDLVEKLRAAFQPYDYEHALWEDIRKRTQGSQERLINYVSVMENMFARFSQKPREETRVAIIRRNLLPYLQTHMAVYPINTLQELIGLGRSVEETELRVRQFCPPPTNPRLLIEPDFMYRKPASSPHPNPVHSVETRSSESGTPNPSTSSDKSSDKPKVLCWNCDSEGHRFKKCSEPKRIFCFRCGNVGVTAPSCPKCKAKKESASRQ